MNIDVAVTFSEAKAEAARELAMRRNVYRKWVASGRMTREQAEKQIARMSAVCEILSELATGIPEHQLQRLRTMTVVSL